MLSRSRTFWMYVNSICFVLMLYEPVAIFGQSYSVKYKIHSQIDSTRATSRLIEQATLFIESSQKSYFYTDNFAFKDSLMKQINLGKVSAFEIIGNTENIRHTRFQQHIKKDLNNLEVSLFENILTSEYLCQFQPNFKWEIQTDTSTIKGYLCNKATGYFGGRTYIAWFTHEIPISDVPHVFCGLPGLIVKVHDDKNQYDFSLVSFEQTKSTSFLKTPNVEKKVISATREQVFKARERLRTQFLEVLQNDFGMRIIDTPEMKQERKQTENRDNNPLELRVD